MPRCIVHSFGANLWDSPTRYVSHESIFSKKKVPFREETFCIEVTRHIIGSCIVYEVTRHILRDYSFLNCCIRLKVRSEPYLFKSEELVIIWYIFLSSNIRPSTQN